jgi:nucleotide-binding universal stress UspA family protein
VSTEIFISYSREDRERVEQIATALKRIGFTVQSDTDVPPGTIYVDLMKNVLQTVRCVVVVWSWYSVKSSFVRDEAAMARGRGVLLAVSIHKGVRVPLGFRDISTLDLSGWRGDPLDPLFEHFAHDVARVVARSGKASNAAPAPPARTASFGAKATKEDASSRERAAAPAPAPTPAVPAATPKSRRKGVFISYSRKDAEWLERLQTHLRPLEREGVVIWDDTRLRPGEPWREEIRKAMAEAKVAILLVSADFLASDFIATDELPPLLKAAKEDGATILPVIISPCGFRRMESLSRFQAVNDPEKPLVQLRRGNREKVLDQVASAVQDALKR